MGKLAQMRISFIALVLFIATATYGQQCRDLTYNFRTTLKGSINRMDVDTASIHINEAEGKVCILEKVKKRGSYVQFRILRASSFNSTREWVVRNLDPNDTQPFLYSIMLLDERTWEFTYMRGETTLIFNNDFVTFNYRKHH